MDTVVRHTANLNVSELALPNVPVSFAIGAHVSKLGSNFPPAVTTRRKLWGKGGLWLAVGVAVSAFVIGQLTIMYAPLGPRSAHMASHIVTMNVFAPWLAVALWSRGGEALLLFQSSKAVLLAASLQLALLWMWHAPRVVAAGAGQPWAHVVVQAALLGASLSFWLGVLAMEGSQRWRAVVATLLTGKIFCLLGALLLFAPRLLYADAAIGHGARLTSLAESLADQQTAGLMMLVACPLCYVGAGVAIAAKWLRDLEAGG
jgi:putative membrane protein